MGTHCFVPCTDFIAYVVFMGTTYYTIGNYYAGLITMGCCVLLLVLTILGAQVLTRIQQASAKLRNVFVKALLWC